MGRKTLESIGIALPERKNIVITHSNEVYIPEVEIAHSLNEAYRLADDEDMFIIGGGEIYRQALADVERIYATKIEHTFENSDTFFPDLDESWEESLRTDYINSDKTKYPFRFITYTRK
jgi:dihydrofolate reductase